MVDGMYASVASALDDQHFPLLYGADCSVRSRPCATGRAAGLLFIDGHEDATRMEASDTGEAANMEIALLLGLTGAAAPPPIRDRLPALDPDSLVMLGQRDELYRHRIGVVTIAGRVRLRPAANVGRQPGPVAAEAAAHLRPARARLVAAHRSRRAAGCGLSRLRRRQRPRHAGRSDLVRTDDGGRDRAARGRLPRVEPRRLQH
jgi:hypothetical protein